MKKLFYPLIVLVFWTVIAKAQVINIDTNSLIYKNVNLGQSMATSDQQALPAQFTVTLPQHGAASYLVNLGLSVDLGSIFSPRNLIAFIGEYHRNTLTDSVQNNLQLGIKGFWKVSNKKNLRTSLFIIYDPQYTYDAVKKVNSIATDLLFTWRSRGGNFDWGKINQVGQTDRYFKPSMLFGTQLQQVFPGDTTAATGFKVRPLGTVNFAYGLLRSSTNINDPVLQLSTSYTQRVTVINSTNDGEKFTHMVRADLEYFIISKPITLSVGASFVDGSDIFAGLKQQQYFLISLNILKAKAN